MNKNDGVFLNINNLIYAENGDWDNTDEDESPIFSFEPLNPEDMQFEF